MDFHATKTAIILVPKEELELVKSLNIFVIFATTNSYFVPGEDNCYVAARCDARQSM